MYIISIVNVAVIIRRHTPWWINKDKSERETAAKEEEDECAPKYVLLYTHWCSTMMTPETPYVKMWNEEEEGMIVCVEEMLLPLGAGVSGKLSLSELCNWMVGSRWWRISSRKKRLPWPLKKRRRAEGRMNVVPHYSVLWGKMKKLFPRLCGDGEQRRDPQSSTPTQRGAHTQSQERTYMQAKGHPA